MVNPDVYPVTHEFEEEFKDLDHYTANQMFKVSEIKEMIQETIGEYEHGTAEVELCEGVTLAQYAAVASDLLNCIASRK